MSLVLTDEEIRDVCYLRHNPLSMADLKEVAYQQLAKMVEWMDEQSVEFYTNGTVGYVKFRIKQRDWDQLKRDANIERLTIDYPEH